MTEQLSADRIALAFLERYWDDHDGGRALPLADYQALFPGHDERIAAEFAAVTGSAAGDLPGSMPQTRASP